MAKNKKRKKKLKKGFLWLIITFIIVAIISTALFCIVKFVPDLNVLTVENFAIVGETPYNEQLIIKTAEIPLGVSILQTSFSDAEERITEKLPYIKNVDISYSFDGTLTLTLVAAKTKYQVKSGAYYYLLDEDYKVIDVLGQRKESTVTIYGVKTNSKFKLGKSIEFKEKSKIELIDEIISLSDKYNRNFEIIDIEDTENIVCVYERKYVVEIGTNTYIEEKIKRFDLMLNELDENEGIVRLDKWTPENKKYWLSSQNIDELVEKY